ncbi:hypothetical protein [Aureibacillus halotolerans]|uniref:Lipoprotein n=1 Tax=Aureibacillus halotolerans TaxID=1508390 RepID=A0A4R6UDC6_9BACI|nr:hypothetical protein [Aureibacillus halotolerans]TDQ42785.1 hypothetical protein EV213_101214 [Aureibacillus halotolerans]
MKKAMYLVLLLVLLLVACQQQNSASETPGAQPPKMTDLSAEPVKPMTQTSQRAADLLAIVQQGTSQNSVKSALGEPSAQMHSAKGEKLLWRYDIGALQTFTPASNEEDEVDTEALKEGLLQFQLFLFWSEDQKVQAYSLHFVEEGGALKNPRMLPNGEIVNE